MPKEKMQLQPLTYFWGEKFSPVITRQIISRLDLRWLFSYWLWFSCRWFFMRWFWPWSGERSRIKSGSVSGTAHFWSSYFPIWHWGIAPVEGKNEGLALLAGSLILWMSREKWFDEHFSFSEKYSSGGNIANTAALARRRRSHYCNNNTKEQNQWVSLTPVLTIFKMA